MVIIVEKRDGTKEAAETIIKQQLGILCEIIDEFHLKLSVTLVSSEKNKTDVLARVQKAWLSIPEESEAGEFMVW